MISRKQAMKGGGCMGMSCVKGSPSPQKRVTPDVVKQSRLDRQEARQTAQAMRQTAQVQRQQERAEKKKVRMEALDALKKKQENTFKSDVSEYVNTFLAANKGTKMTKAAIVDIAKSVVEIRNRLAQVQQLQSMMGGTKREKKTRIRK